MRISKKLSYPTLLFVGLGIIYPFLIYLQFPLANGELVNRLEDIQALLLLSAAIFSYYFIQPFQYSAGQKQFWLWVIFCWILLFGRSISWGRDYFADVSHDYFRLISILCIAPVLLMLFSRKLRAEILNKFKTTPLPIFSLALALSALGIADAIEHDRAMAAFLLHDLAYKDFLEEMYEFALIWGLFEACYWLMQQEKASV